MTNTLPDTVSFEFYNCENKAVIVVLKRDGDAVEFTRSYEHDEGYNHTHELLKYEGDKIVYDLDVFSCDCDGPLEGYNTYVCLIRDLPDDQSEPLWERVSGYQRDRFAEDMGY